MYGGGPVHYVAQAPLDTVKTVLGLGNVSVHNAVVTACPATFGCRQRLTRVNSLVLGSIPVNAYLFVERETSRCASCREDSKTVFPSRSP